MFAWALRRLSLRNRSRERLSTNLNPAKELGQGSFVTQPMTGLRIQPFNRRRYFLPWLLAATAGSLSLVFVPIPALYIGTSTLIVGLLLMQFDSFFWERRNLRMEQQLADALDLMISGLHAGAGLFAALEITARTTPLPLKRQLDEVIGRIRLGDDAKTAYLAFQCRVPLETFRLFTTTLITNWEVGGSLATTLSTVARTIRDRIDIARRMNAFTAEAKISVIMVLFITYFLAYTSFMMEPERFSTFATSFVGKILMAGTMLLQVVGIVWASKMAEMKY